MHQGYVSFPDGLVSGKARCGGYEENRFRMAMVRSALLTMPGAGCAGRPGIGPAARRRLIYLPPLRRSPDGAKFLSATCITAGGNPVQR